MTRFRGRRRAPCLRLGLIAILLATSTACFAKSVGIDDDSALQSGPCFQALVDRNVAQPTTAPNRELGSACAAEHGDVERAWARVVRLWGSDSADVPDYDSYRRADDSASPRPVWRGLAVVGMILVYAVCGTPLRPIAGMLGMLTGGGGTLRRVGEAIADLCLRSLLGWVLLRLLSLPYATLACSLAFVVIAARATRARAGTATARQPEDASGQASGFAVLVAGAINDVLGAFPGLVGLALLAQHDARWLAVAIGLALVASVPAVIAARRRLRTRPLAAMAAGALLAAAIGALAELDPPLAALVGGPGLVGFVAPLALALLVLASGWRSVAARAPLKSEA